MFDRRPIIQVQLPCCHNFHSLCIRKWVRIRAKCPLCAESVYINNPEGSNGDDTVDSRVDESYLPRSRISQSLTSDSPILSVMIEPGPAHALRVFDFRPRVDSYGQGYTSFSLEDVVHRGQRDDAVDDSLPRNDVGQGLTGAVHEFDTVVNLNLSRREESQRARARLLAELEDAAEMASRAGEFGGQDSPWRRRYPRDDMLPLSRSISSRSDVGDIMIAEAMDDADGVGEVVGSASDSRSSIVRRPSPQPRDQSRRPSITPISQEEIQRLAQRAQRLIDSIPDLPMA